MTGANELQASGGEKDTHGITAQDFYAYMPAHLYIFTPTREFWPAASVNTTLLPVDIGAAKPIKPNIWLDEHRAVHQMTWAPGMPMVIAGKLVAEGGWIERMGSDCFNLYRPPTIEHGDKSLIDPWLDHLAEVYPEDHGHIVRWLAHRVQRPGEKINHALVLGGAQGIGKDTILEPVKQAIGPWNFAEISPGHLLGRFNGFVKSVILRISEARDLGDVDRYSFYDHSKVYTASPPDVLRCDEKNLREHAIWNVCGVIITSNHKTNGIYLPPDDRRHYVAWSERTKEEFSESYWRDLYGWYAAGGNGHVAAYLASMDLSAWDPKAPPPKTSAWHDIVSANRAPENAELADALALLNYPSVITVAAVCTHASDDFRLWLQDRRNSRQIPHRFEEGGYVAVRNESARDGLWKFNGRRQVIYGRRELSVRDRLSAATAWCREAGQ